MRNVMVLVGGMVLLVLGVQGGIRLIADHDNAGLLTWLPGGFAAQLVCYVFVAALGAALASWAKRRHDRSESDR